MSYICEARKKEKKKKKSKRTPKAHARRAIDRAAIYTTILNSHLLLHCTNHAVCCNAHTYYTVVCAGGVLPFALYFYRFLQATEAIIDDIVNKLGMRTRYCTHPGRPRKAKLPPRSEKWSASREGMWCDVM